MALGKHVDADKLIAEARDHRIHKHTGNRSDCFRLDQPEVLISRLDLHDIPYGSRYDVDVDLPRFKIPEQGVDGKVVYQLLHDELMLGESWYLGNLLT